MAKLRDVETAGLALLEKLNFFEIGIPTASFSNTQNNLWALITLIAGYMMEWIGGIL